MCLGALFWGSGGAGVLPCGPEDQGRSGLVSSASLLLVSLQVRPLGCWLLFPVAVCPTAGLCNAATSASPPPGLRPGSDSTAQLQ